MRLHFALPVLAALTLVACGDENEQAQIPELNEYDSPVPEAPADDVAQEAPTDLAPADQAVQETTQALSEAADAVSEAAQTVAGVAAEQLDQFAEGQTVAELGTAAQGFAEQVSEQVSGGAGGALGGLNALVGEAAGALEDAARAVQEEVAAASPEVDWQRTYAAEVPFYNLSETAVNAYRQPDLNSAVVGEVAPGDGGFIQTCNATLDWCLIPFGEGNASGWVDMSAFGGVAN